MLQQVSDARPPVGAACHPCTQRGGSIGSTVRAIRAMWSATARSGVLSAAFGAAAGRRRRREGCWGGLGDPVVSCSAPATRSPSVSGSRASVVGNLSPVALARLSEVREPLEDQHSGHPYRAEVER